MNNNFIAQKKNGTFRVVSYPSAGSCHPKISAHGPENRPIVFQTPEEARDYLVAAGRIRSPKDPTTPPYYMAYGSY